MNHLDIITVNNISFQYFNYHSLFNLQRGYEGYPFFDEGAYVRKDEGWDCKILIPKEIENNKEEIIEYLKIQMNF